MCQISFVPCKISFCLNWAQRLATEPCSQPGNCKPTYHPFDTYTGFEYCARCQKAIEATAHWPRYPAIQNDPDPSEYPSVTESTQEAEEHDAGIVRIGYSPSSSPNIAMGRECEYYYPPTAEEGAYDDEVRKADRARRIDDEESNRLMLGLNTPTLIPPPLEEEEPVYKPYRPAVKPAMRPPTPYPGNTNQPPAYKRPAYQRPVYVRPDDNEVDSWKSPDSLLGKDDGLGLRDDSLVDSIVDMYLADSTTEGEPGLRGESDTNSIVEMYTYL